MNRNFNFSSKARRLTRRLSYGISKVLRDWNNDSTEGSTQPNKYNSNEFASRTFDIDELVQLTKFSRSEIKFIYRDFKQKCPNGMFNEKTLVEIYNQYFSCGNCQIFAKHLFSAFVQHNSKRIETPSLTFTTATFGAESSSSDLNGQPKTATGAAAGTAVAEREINFKEFLVVLSAITRGSLDDRLRWLFNYYDINRDGRITGDEVASLINSLYDLMGNYVQPSVDDYTRLQHVNSTLGVIFLFTSFFFTSNHH